MEFDPDSRTSINLSWGQHQTDPSTVFLFGDYVEYYSTNGGVSFQESVITPFSCVAFSTGALPDRREPGWIDVRCHWTELRRRGTAGRGYGLYKSTNAGILWNKLGSGVLPSYLPGFAVRPEQSFYSLCC